LMGWTLVDDGRDKVAGFAETGVCLQRINVTQGGVIFQCPNHD
jgi:hypothetical protein